MGAGYSEVQIYNMVLDHLEEESAATINDLRAPVKWLNRNFPIHRDALLRKGMWGFARKRMTVVRDTTNPPFEWNYRYAMPGDLLRLLPYTYASRTGYTPYQYHIEGSFILANITSPANLLYIRRVSTTGDFDSLFTLALASRLALAMAHWMTGKNSYVESLRYIHERELNDALEVDQVENNFQTPYDDEFLLARE